MLGAFFRNGGKGIDINTSLAQIQPEQLCEKFLPFRDTSWFLNMTKAAKWVGGWDHSTPGKQDASIKKCLSGRLWAASSPSGDLQSTVLFPCF